MMWDFTAPDAWSGLPAVMRLASLGSGLPPDVICLPCLPCHASCAIVQLKSGKVAQYTLTRLVCLWCWAPTLYPSGAEALEAQMQALRQEQKQLVVQLADKGANPEGLGEGLLAALVHLKDRREARGTS